METELQTTQRLYLGKCDKLCRICLSEDAVGSSPLHSARSCGSSLASMVMAVARVEIRREDGLPDVICGDCVGELEQAHGFRLKCERSDTQLRKLYHIVSNQTNTDQVKEEDSITKLVKIESNETNEALDLDDYFNSEDAIDFTENKLVFKEDEKVLNSFDNGINDSHENKDSNKINKNAVVKVKRTNCNSKTVVKTYKQKKCHSTETDDPLTDKLENDNKINKFKVDSVIETTVRKNKDRMFICDLCGRPLKSKASLDQHKLRMHREEKNIDMVTVTGWGVDKRYRCSECPFNCHSRQTMLLHRRTHTGEKPHQCPHCPASFSQTSSLSQHVTIHSDQQPFECETCGKQFRLKEKLRLHKFVHAKAQHACGICDKRLKTKRILKYHIKRHLDIRDIYCELCGIGFVAKENLNNHLKIHLTMKNFECDVCGLKFKTKPNLIRHIMLHTARREFKCEVCDYAATTRYSLQHHMMKHSKEKNFECSICQLKMRHGNSMYNHMLQQHGIRFKSHRTDNKISSIK